MRLLRVLTKYRCVVCMFVVCCLGKWLYSRIYKFHLESISSISVALVHGSLLLGEQPIPRKRQELGSKEQLISKKILEDPSFQMVQWRVIDNFSGDGGTWNQ